MKTRHTEVCQSSSHMFVPPPSPSLNGHVDFSSCSQTPAAVVTRVMSLPVNMSVGSKAALATRELLTQRPHTDVTAIDEHRLPYPPDNPTIKKRPNELYQLPLHFSGSTKPPRHAYTMTNHAVAAPQQRFQETLVPPHAHESKLFPIHRDARCRLLKNSRFFLTVDGQP